MDNIKPEILTRMKIKSCRAILVIISAQRNLRRHHFPYIFVCSSKETQKLSSPTFVDLNTCSSFQGIHTNVCKILGTSQNFRAYFKNCLCMREILQIVRLRPMWDSLQNHKLETLLPSESDCGALTSKLESITTSK